MQLKSLLDHVDVIGVQGSVDRPVTSVTRDSREVGPESVFVAIVGSRVDGHSFVPTLGAAAVVVERDVVAPPGVTVIRVASGKLALAQLAAARFGHPGAAIPVVGITGTNGKTTVATLADLALGRLGWRTGRIGTTGNVVAGNERPTTFTTPEAPQVQELLADMRDAGVGAVLMEVTSIGLAQRRVDGIPFELGVFTNLTRDHLDFHGTFEAYREAKARLFQELLAPHREHPPALLCGDDPAWADMQAPAGSWRYGFGEACDLRLWGLEPDPAGMTVMLQSPEGSSYRLRSALIGPHNALNLAAAWGILRCLGIDGADAADALSQVPGVPGRLERVVDRRGNRLVVVDFAHTEDALKSALEALRPLTTGALWVVFGCGGDRDAGKRPRMGRVAEQSADRVVVTSDNPRSEPPSAIVEQIQAGFANPSAAIIEVDRRAAIRLAIHATGPGDVVLIAGKGHETYQEVAGQRYPFDDRQVAEQAMEDA